MLLRERGGEKAYQYNLIVPLLPNSDAGGSSWVDMLSLESHIGGQSRLAASSHR